MYMKVFPHGQGGGDGPTHYLVRPDYPGRDELPPEVLRGDVDTTRALIGSLDTKWKFTAGVLSWHPDDKVTRQQFNALQQSLSELSKNALNTTEAAIQRQLSSLEQSVSTRCRTLSWMFARKWLQILLITMSILAGATLGGWGLFTLAENKATALQREIATLWEQKTAMKKTVAQLQAQTWGLVLVESPQGRFIVPPVKSTLKPGWTIDENPAWKLE